jgi:hypothetical protein
MSKSDVLDVLARARKMFTTEEWIDFLIRSIGHEPSALSERARRVVHLRLWHDAAISRLTEILTVSMSKSLRSVPLSV